MNKIHRLILILPLVILGCTSNRVDEIKVIKKIDSLDMNIFSENGDKIYSIYSPHTTYDNNIRKFKLKKTTINIFEGKKAKYIINSNESSLMNNNKLLELKGNVKLKTIDKEEDTLQADYFYWDIKETDYLLKGNIIFENKI